MSVVPLQTIVTFLDETLQTRTIPDYPNACNGLQLENNGKVTRIAGAVDANVHIIEAAIAQKADLLFVHHGLTWQGLKPMTGPLYRLYQQAMAANLAIYSAHLPLDSHPTYGHNVQIAKVLGLKIEGGFAFYNKNSFGWLCQGIERETLCHRLQALFPRSFHPILYGSLHPQKIAIVSGGGGSSVEEMIASSIDTLITGEVHYSVVSLAQLYRLNLLVCGHYATECFGVQALLPVLQERMQIPCFFIENFCEL
ncbi:MAG: Nif3-like dinuclear metal center hexameric protein [Opitutales bacterium]|nr:Nif3-like dinuclear metal center hexameric protein [Opitutales bacterium]